MSGIENVSRRTFLAGGIVAAGALVLGVRYYPKLATGDKLPHDTHTDHATLNPSVYVGINPDGTVWIVASRSEMGTTSRTTLPLIVADELDADWKRVKIEQAIGDKRYGDQFTDGSHSIRSFYDAMRQAGATARFMLIQAAAKEWRVPASECETDLHVVIHRSTNRSSSYGELATAAARFPIPKREELKLKPKSAWRYIGKGQVSYDLEALVTGRAIFGMDARVDGMVYASVEHPPVLGGKIKSFDDKEALKVPGVQQTVAIDPFKPPPPFQPLGGIAVIADTRSCLMHNSLKSFPTVRGECLPSRVRSARIRFTRLWHTFARCQDRDLCDFATETRRRQVLDATTCNSQTWSLETAKTPSQLSVWLARAAYGKLRLRN